MNSILFLLLALTPGSPVLGWGGMGVELEAASVREGARFDGARIDLSERRARLRRTLERELTEERGGEERASFSKPLPAWRREDEPVAEKLSPMLMIGPTGLGLVAVGMATERRFWRDMAALLLVTFSIGGALLTLF